MLYLDGDGGGVVNNVCFPSTVAPSYAPSGKVRPPHALLHRVLCAVSLRRIVWPAQLLFFAMGAIATLRRV